MDFAIIDIQLVVKLLLLLLISIPLTNVIKQCRKSGWETF